MRAPRFDTPAGARAYAAAVVDETHAESLLHSLARVVLALLDRVDALEARDEGMAPASVLEDAHKGIGEAKRAADAIKGQALHRRRWLALNGCQRARLWEIHEKGGHVPITDGRSVRTFARLAKDGLVVLRCQGRDLPSSQAGNADEVALTQVGRRALAAP